MVNSYQKSTDLKYSEVEWLEKIPQEWIVNRGKYLLQSKKEINEDMRCDNVLSLTMKGVLHRSELGEGGLLPSDYSTFQIFYPKDLVFKLIDLNNYKTSRVGIVDEKGIMSSAYIRIFSKNNDIFPKYYYYFYYNLYLQGIYNFIGMGVRSTMNAKELLELRLIKPSYDDQKRIADFLDLKTKMVDQIIETKQKLIKLQKNKIESLVLGDSKKSNHQSIFWNNIEPEWKLEKARWIFEEINIKNMPNEEPLAVTQDRGVLPKKMCEEQFVSSIDYRVSKFVDMKNFIISLRSFEGGIEFSNFRGIVSPAYTIMRLKPKYNNVYFQMYYQYLLKTPQFITLLNTIVMGIRDGKNINFSDFRNLILPIPTEQSIKIFIKEFNKYERLVLYFEKEKKLLNEYRSSLIYNAVTGKIKI